MIRKRSSETTPLLLSTWMNKNEEKQRPSNEKINSKQNTIKQENHDSVALVWLNLDNQLPSNTINLFRSMTCSCRVYTDVPSCFDDLRFAKEQIFFISSSSDTEFIQTVHNFQNVEGIFILDSYTDKIEGYYPKLMGLFTSADELLREFKATLYIFEQVQMEDFVFEEKNTFIWRQLWKEDLINRKSTANKNDFAKAIRSYYKDNSRMMGFIDEFEKSYRSTDALKWCCRLPIPGRMLTHAIHSQNSKQMQLCRFLFVDATKVFQKQAKRKTCLQVYRGMKLSNQQIDQFENQIGKLMCTDGFFPCMKSRIDALAFASSPTYRPDLCSVLLKIDCEASNSSIELTNSSSLATVVFDVCMTFRVMCISRGPMTVIKLKTAGLDGKKIAQNYLSIHQETSIEALLDQLCIVEKTPILCSIPEENSDELKAKQYVDRDDIDLALITYKRIQPVTARILNIIGELSLEKKGDSDHAFQCHSQALKMQEQNGEDVVDTLIHLAKVYHHRQDFDQELDHYQRALRLQEKKSSSDQISIVPILMGMANSYWKCQEYKKAISHGERALALQEQFNPSNKIELAKILAQLGNIYYDCDQYPKALNRCLEALTILEYAQPLDLFLLAEVLNNLGNIQQDSGAKNEALNYLERSVEIYKRILPNGHPERVSAEMDFERV